MIVSTQGQQRGAVLFEYNLNSPSSSPSGIWDVHSRVGGFAGSNLRLADCPTTPNITVTASNLNQNCIAAYLTMHLTKPSSGLYLENVWLWVADHDVEDPQLRQITIYAGRGLLDESQAGTNWLIGTAVEHHTKYEYQFVNTQNVFAGQIQTETACKSHPRTSRRHCAHLIQTINPTHPRLCLSRTLPAFSTHSSRTRLPRMATSRSQMQTAGACALSTRTIS